MTNISYEEILDGMTDGISVQDLEFNIVYQNRMMRDAFGPHIGQKCYAIYEKRDKVCEGCGVLKAMRTRTANVVLRTGVLISGKLTSWENCCVPLFNKTGQVIAGMEVCRNITSRVSLEDEVRERNIQLGQMNDQLERRTAELKDSLEQREIMEEILKQEIRHRAQLEEELRQSQRLEAVGQLAAGIAHEINTPTQYIGDNVLFLRDAFAGINTIFKAYSQLMAAAKKKSITPELLTRVNETIGTSDYEYLCEQIPRAINGALEGIQHVANIVRAMKSFSHPNSKEMLPANINDAIETTIMVARGEWKSVADIELDLDASLPNIPCFLCEFNQCVLNLLINAAHAIGDVIRQKKTEGKGRITVRTKRDGDFADIRIADTGTGIPESVRHRVFEPFFTTKEVGKGTGQGLSFVYNAIVKRHGGTVSFQTNTGQGTVFILRLPISAQLSEAPTSVSRVRR